MSVKLFLSFFLMVSLPFFLLATDCGLQLEITDNSNNGTPSTITINSAPGTALGVDVVLGEVRLIIDHPRVSDLYVRLYSPNGDFVNLITQEGIGENFGDPTDNSCEAYTRFVMDFNAPKIINSTAPFLGDHLPNQVFDVLYNGGSPFGDWTLVVWDLTEDISGTLEYWDMTLTTLPACQAPSEAYTEVFQDTIVYVSWPSNNNEIFWNVEYGEAGFSLGSGTALISLNDSITLTGLLPNTDYELYLQTDCDTLLSNWSGPFPFVTQCLPFLGDSLGTPIVVPGLPFYDTGNTAECFTDALPDNLGPEAVYRFRMGSCADSVTVSLCGSDFDTSLFIYDSLGTEIGTSSNFCGLQSRLTMAVSPNTIYYAIIEGKNSSGPYQIEITENISIPIILEHQAIHVSCYGSSDGAISFLADGGLPPYSYAWEGGLSTGNIMGLDAGNYNVTIIDANGCEGIPIAVEIVQPDFFLVWAEVEDESLSGADDGSIEIFVSGGIPPYTYLWDTGETTSAIENLAPDRYCATITDDVGCSTISCRPTFAGPTAIGEIDGLTTFDIFPNPSRDFVWLEMNYSGSEILKLEIVNTLGQLMMKQELASGENLVGLDVAHLLVGTYFVRLGTSKNMEVRRLVIL